MGVGVVKPSASTERNKPSSIPKESKVVTYKNIWFEVAKVAVIG
jgi:hypothetical protein